MFSVAYLICIRKGNETRLPPSLSSEGKGFVVKSSLSSVIVRKNGGVQSRNEGEFKAVDHSRLIIPLHLSYVTDDYGKNKKTIGI